jgi:hypothetical protein
MRSKSRNMSGNKAAIPRGNKVSTQIKFALRLVLIVSLFSFAPSTRATTLARVSLDQLAAAADGVARVRCTGVQTQWKNGSIWTVTSFDVVEPMKGNLASRIAVRLPGGRVGALTATVEGTPKFSPLEEAIVFLQRMPTGEYSVAAWAEGTFRIALDAKTRQEFVTQDSSGFGVFDAATRTFRAEGIRKMPIGLFRARLDAALARAGEKSR